jgi:transposase-like protein
MASCPRCGRNAKHPVRPHVFRCKTCRMDFEDTDDGTVTYGRPSKRMEKAEDRAFREELAKLRREQK